ncbi:MAG: hypothetical protein JWM10_1492, partial [Myxococcaceae bacterium]|nr:hypothetical protein [Myxococcaceae bacterium]
PSTSRSTWAPAATAAALLGGAIVTVALVALHARFVASVARRRDSAAPDAMERPTLLAMSLVVGAGALGRLHSRSQGLAVAEPVAALTAVCAEVIERARGDARAAWWVVGLQALVLLAANAPWLVRHAVPAHGCPARPYVSMSGERYFTDRP